MKNLDKLSISEQLEYHKNISMTLILSLVSFSTSIIIMVIACCFAMLSPINIELANSVFYVSLPFLALFVFYLVFYFYIYYSTKKKCEGLD